MNKLDFKEGQTYICKRDDLKWWTLDKEYKVQTFNSGDLCITDDDGCKWSVTNNLMNQVFTLKENTKMNTPEIEEGQIYVCERDKLENWTLCKEYKVQRFSNGGLYLIDDDKFHWYLPNDNLMKNVFKLKEKTFDLNKLTTAQLKEYVDLLEDKENAERLLNEFIERVSK